MLVWPLTTLPFLRHTKLKGPLSDGVVVNTAVSPGQLVRLARGVEFTLVSTVNVALANQYMTKANASYSNVNAAFLEILGEARRASDASTSWSSICSWT